MTISEKDIQCIVLVIVSCVLIVYNLLYNNLLINLRFLAKMRCVTCGICFYDVLNFVWCNCCLNKLCRDRCFSIGTTIKWVLKGGIMGYTIYMVRGKITQYEDDFQVGEIERTPGTSRLDLYLIVYLLQHPIFFFARPIFFLFYSILTCCCDKGDEIDGAEEFNDRVVSFDFIPHELGLLNNFQYHPVGRNEIEYNRGLSIVRQQSQMQRLSISANNAA